MPTVWGRQPRATTEKKSERCPISKSSTSLPHLSDAPPPSPDFTTNRRELTIMVFCFQPKPAALLYHSFRLPPGGFALLRDRSPTHTTFAKDHFLLAYYTFDPLLLQPSCRTTQTIDAAHRPHCFAVLPRPPHPHTIAMPPATRTNLFLFFHPGPISEKRPKCRPPLQAQPIWKSWI